MSGLHKPRCVRTRHSGDVKPPKADGSGMVGKPYFAKRMFMVLLGFLQPGAGGILVLHLIGALGKLDGETMAFLVVGGFLWGCHRGNCMFLSIFSGTESMAFPGQGFPGGAASNAGLAILGCLGAMLYGAVPQFRDFRKLLSALAAVAWGLFGVIWHQRKDWEGTQ